MVEANNQFVHLQITYTHHTSEYTYMFTHILSSVIHISLRHKRVFKVHSQWNLNVAWSYLKVNAKTKELLHCSRVFNPYPNNKGRHTCVWPYCDWTMKNFSHNVGLPQWLVLVYVKLYRNPIKLFWIDYQFINHFIWWYKKFKLPFFKRNAELKFGKTTLANHNSCYKLFYINSWTLTFMDKLNSVTWKEWVNKIIIRKLLYMQ